MASSSTPAAAEKSTLYYLSIDIESVGERYNNSVIAIGACFGPADGSWSRDKLITFRANVKPMPGDQEDPKTMAEFWSKPAIRPIYDEIKRSHEDVDIVMEKFLTFCQQLVALYEDDPSQNGKIKIISDCPDFDLGRLHYLGEVATGIWHWPIRSLGKPNARHGQVDPSERLDALGKWDDCERWIQKNVPSVVHDHRPEHDATHSYYQMVYLERQGRDL